MNKRHGKYFARLLLNAGIIGFLPCVILSMNVTSLSTRATTEKQHYLYYTSGDVIRCVDLSRKKRFKIADFRKTDFDLTGKPTYSPQKNFFAIEVEYYQGWGKWDRYIILYDHQKDTIIAEIKSTADKGRQYRNPSFSPDGEKLGVELLTSKPDKISIKQFGFIDLKALDGISGNLAKYVKLLDNFTSTEDGKIFDEVYLTDKQRKPSSGITSGRPFRLVGPYPNLNIMQRPFHWAPDNDRIAYTNFDCTVTIGRISTGEILDTFNGIAPVFSCDGKNVYYLLDKGTTLAKRDLEAKTSEIVSCKMPAHFSPFMYPFANLFSGGNRDDFFYIFQLFGFADEDTLVLEGIASRFYVPSYSYLAKYSLKKKKGKMLRPYLSVGGACIVEEDDAPGVMKQ